MSQLLSGKIALVTGGGSGIGRATCKILDREGATVIACDINESSAQETIRMLTDPSKHMAVATDVSKSESVDAAIASVVTKYKASPTLLANCAGIICPHVLKSLDDSELAKCLDVNLKGTIVMCRAVAKAMESHGSKQGCFVNISSHTVQGLAGSSVYSASKGGVVSFTKSIAKELIKEGIRVNCVLPGPIDTPMVQNVVKGNPEMEELMKVFIGQSFIGRIGQPEEVGEVVAFLLSDRSSFMVGSLVEVDGGIQCP